MENLDKKIVKPKIAEIIGMEVSDGWDIYDKDLINGLYLIHYNRNANMEKYGHIRGIVVDVFNKCIVCASYSHTPGVVADALDDVEHQTLKDTNGNDFLFNMKDYIFKKSIEGFILRVFMYNGKLYYSTNRKLNIMNTRSRWGPTTQFRDMLKKLGTPTREIFYPETDKLYSPWVVILMVTHRDVLHGTRELVGNGYISYLDTIKMWDDESLYPDGSVSMLKPQMNNLTTDVNEAKNNDKYYSSKELSLDEINNHLKYGNSTRKLPSDLRMGNGEFVVAIKKDNNQWPINCIRIQSTAYTWRLSIRGDGLNLYRQYLLLLNSTKIDTTIDDEMVVYKQKFPLLNIYNVKSIISHLNNGNIITEWKQDNISNSSVLTPEGRIYNIWACYIMASPYHLQKKIAYMYDKFFNDKKQLVNYIFKQYKNHNYSFEKDEYINNLIIKVLTYIKNKAPNNNYDHDTMIKNTIDKEIQMRNGANIYRMIKTMNENK